MLKSSVTIASLTSDCNKDLSPKKSNKKYLYKGLHIFVLKIFIRVLKNERIVQYSQ